MPSGAADAGAAQAIDVDAAIKNALANRTDILQLRKNMESTDIDRRKFAESEAAGGRPERRATG